MNKFSLKKRLTLLWLVIVMTLGTGVIPASVGLDITTPAHACLGHNGGGGC